MKWIKNRKQFLLEAKVRDVIFPKQAKEVINSWGEKYLDYEEIEATPNIKQGKWTLDEDDKNKVLGAFFQCDMSNVFEIFNNLPDELATAVNQSINTDLISKDKREKYTILLKDFDIKKPTIDQMVILFDNVFRKLSVNETTATEMIQKDENGRPVRDEEGNMIKIQKEAGAPIYTKNLVNINSFLGDYNRCYRDNQIPTDTFNDRDLNNLRNMAKDHFNSYTADFEIFNRDLHLYISHNPKDILNMSISKFYSSCQHLYDGGYRSQLLGNVFDPNSVPAYLIFDTPLFWEDDKISEFLPLTRMIVRNIESFEEDEEAKLFFDRAYPDRMKDVFGEIIEKYTENKETEPNPRTYYYTPDIELDDSDSRIRDPYMDRLRMEKRPYIGVNTKTLYLSRSYDWSRVKVAPNAKIKELVIETTEIPDNLLDIDISLEWIKFKYLKLNTLSGFDKVKTDSIAFDKCKFTPEILKQMAEINPDITRLQIISCDANNFDVSMFTKLEELHVVYTVDSIDELTGLLENTNLKKLVISGDLIKDKESKSYINSLKSKMRVEIVGPVI